MSLQSSIEVGERDITQDNCNVIIMKMTKKFFSQTIEKIKILLVDEIRKTTKGGLRGIYPVCIGLKKRDSMLEEFIDKTKMAKLKSKLHRKSLSIKVNSTLVHNKFPKPPDERPLNFIKGALLGKM